MSFGGGYWRQFGPHVLYWETIRMEASRDPCALVVLQVPFLLCCEV